MGPEKTRGLCVALCAVIVIGALAARLTLISRSMPYVGHIDEREISDRAANILKTGDWNPHFFKYPSLPIYLAAAGLTVGFFDACAKRKIREVAQIGRVYFPFYEQPTVVYPARALWATLSVLAIGLLALLVYRLTEIPHVLWLAPLVASASTFYLYLSWKYLNVDVIGAFFVMATLLYLISEWERFDTPRKSAAAGALCGLAVACKYSLFPILLPALLTIWLAAPRERGGHTLVLLAAMAAAFVAGTPYALLDFPSFLNDVGGEVRHYAHGHPGFVAEPGLTQLAYYATRMIREVGVVATLLALAGVAEILSHDARRGLVFLSFGAAELAYMSLQRVHFLRNIIAVQLCFAGLVAVGVVVAYRAALALFGSLPSVAGRPAMRSAAAFVLVAALFAAGLPIGNIVSAYDFTPDSRNRAVRWMRANLPNGARILVPSELSMNSGPLNEAFRVATIELRHGNPQLAADPAGSYVLLPSFGHDPRKPSFAEVAAQANRAVESLHVRVLQEFGENPVMLLYAEPVPEGNPHIRIAQLLPPQP